jgi:hypothetical protein
MEIRSFESLTTPDERTLHFGPLGLGGAMPGEIATEHQQRVVAPFGLVDQVPEHTRRAFERLQLLHTYGVFCYEFFTVADENSLLVLELALAERFMAFYGNEVPFVIARGPDKGKELPLGIQYYDEVYRAVRSDGSHSQPNIYLKPKSGNKPFRFNGLFSDLIRWARSERLLGGQRNRRIEPVYARMRNRVAHPRSTNITMPVNSARSIRDTAEIINRLWGQNTSGGRLYPAPLDLDVVVLGWNHDGSETTSFRAECLDRTDLDEDWSWIVINALFDDQLNDFNSRYETTGYPSQLLHGPGRYSEIRAWIESTHPSSIQVDYLDRYFLIRVDEDRMFWPMRPSVASGLQDPNRKGLWHLIKADFPGDAFVHLRGGPWGSAIICSKSGTCDNCAVEHVGKGKLDTMLRRLRALGEVVEKERPTPVAVPSRWQIMKEATQS